MQAVANNPEFAKKVGVKQSIGREFTKEKSMKTKKMMGGGMADRRGRAMTRMGADAAGRAMMMKGGKVKKMRMGGNTSRMNELEELGRVDAEKGYTKKGKRNLAAEKRRVVGEIKNKKAGGKVKGYDEGGKVTMTSMMKDKEGRALAKNKKKMTAKQMADAAGRAMKAAGRASGSAKKKLMDRAKAARAGARAGARVGAKAARAGMKMGGEIKKQGYNARLDDSLGARKGKKSQSLKARRDESKGMKKSAGKKAYSGNRKSAQGSASKRADGIARKGRTKGRMV